MTAQGIHLDEAQKDSKPWKKNCCRNVWSAFRRQKLAPDVKISTYNYDAGNGTIVPLSYVAPSDLVQYLLMHHPEILVGGLTSQTERSKHLQAFWEAFRLQEGSHMVFEEHNDNLANVIPLFWHGDEGRGKRRGGTAVVSCQTVMGLHTAVNVKKRKMSEDCSCDPPNRVKNKYNHVRPKLPQSMLEALRYQATTQKGHSFLHQWPLFVLPSAVLHPYPRALLELLEVMALDFRKLFFEGVSIGQRNWCVAICGAKGDLKWFAKVALQRSFENQGRVRNIPCCHECLGGTDGVAWEDTSESPVWAPSRFVARPWTDRPVTMPIPYCRSAPEMQFKRDPFHIAKVGIFRDCAGSTLCFLVYYGYFGDVGDFSERLNNAHSMFSLYCSTTSNTPAFKSFSRSLMMYPRFAAYPWANVKGSDSVLLLKWLAVQCAAFTLTPKTAAHIALLQRMADTCNAGVSTSVS